MAKPRKPPMRQPCARCRRWFRTAQSEGRTFCYVCVPAERDDFKEDTDQLAADEERIEAIRAREYEHRAGSEDDADGE